MSFGSSFAWPKPLLFFLVTFHARLEMHASLLTSPWPFYVASIVIVAFKVRLRIGIIARIMRLGPMNFG